MSKLKAFSKRTAESIYIEWVNEWLTIKSMADNYNMHAQDLGRILDKGRKENTERISNLTREEILSIK
jgi:hypothetical protein